MRMAQHVTCPVHPQADAVSNRLLSCLISSKISLMGTNDHSVPSQSAFKQCDLKAVNYITSMLGYFSTIFQCGSGTASQDCLHFKTCFFLSGSWGSLNVREPLIIQGIHLHVALSINETATRNPIQDPLIQYFVELLDCNFETSARQSAEYLDYFYL